MRVLTQFRKKVDTLYLAKENKGEPLIATHPIFTMEKALERIRAWTPESQQPLNLSFLGLTSLPPLPSGLTGLDCGYNNLSSPLPPLPVTLTYLFCSHNRLTSLPSLPIHITHLKCEHNLLTTLPPPLHSTILVLWRQSTLLFAIPRNDHS